MYSRNRMAGEEKYTDNVPPLYSGNRFSYPRREYEGSDHGRKEEVPVPAAPPEAQTEEEEDIPEEETRESPAEDLPERPERTGWLSGIGQEELLLIALLLLLSAEHERCMDVIVVLLLLIGIH